jgi:hypothetical protein
MRLQRISLAHSPKISAILDQSRASLRSGQGLRPQAFWKAVAQRKRSSKGKRPSQ